MFLTLACVLGLLLLIGTSLITRAKNIHPQESYIDIKVEEPSFDEDQLILAEDQGRRNDNQK